MILVTHKVRFVFTHRNLTEILGVAFLQEADTLIEEFLGSLDNDVGSLHRSTGGDVDQVPHSLFSIHGLAITSSCSRPRLRTRRRRRRPGLCAGLRSAARLAGRRLLRRAEGRLALTLACKDRR